MQNNYGKNLFSSLIGPQRFGGIHFHNILQEVLKPIFPVEEKLKLWIFTIMDLYLQYKKSIIMKLYP